MKEKEIKLCRRMEEREGRKAHKGGRERKGGRRKEGRGKERREKKGGGELGEWKG